MTIGIAGCGIGGLAAAALLARAGLNVTIYDKFAVRQPVGSGLVMQPVGLSVLNQIGALDYVLEHGARITHLTGHIERNNAKVLDAKYGGRPGIGIHRASLFEALFQVAMQNGAVFVSDSEVQSTTLQANKRLISLASGKVCGPFDLVIDATGAHSPISPILNRKLPFGALWATVDWPQNAPLPATHLSQKYHRASKMAGVLPIGTLPGQSDRLAAIFWSVNHRDFARWRNTPIADWRDQAAEFWPQFAPFVNQIGTHQDFTMATYSHGTLGQTAANRLVHIGDAAHTASPQLGQGANMALLDAFALAHAITTNEHADLANSLARYAASRRSHIRLYQLMSRLFTPLYQSDSAAPPMIRDNIFAPLSQLWPTQYFLTRLVGGTLIPPVRGVTLPKIRL